MSLPIIIDTDPGIDDAEQSLLHYLIQNLMSK